MTERAADHHQCDGGVPSCLKCAKAGEACIDVDARQAGHAIPRAYVLHTTGRRLSELSRS